MKRKTFLASILLYNLIGLTVAIGGWLWEVLLFLIKDRQFVNRGFLYGPYLPVYGVGAVFLSLLFSLWKRMRKSVPPQNKNAFAENIRIFLYSMCGGCLTEFSAGWILWHLFHKKYWDYSGYPLNISGYVCIYSALGFGLFGVIWVKWMAPRLIRAWERLPSPMQFFLVGLFDLILITDAVFALMQPNSGKNITFF